jgi:glycosyltransferase involved in cell wall biosynthesis
VLRDGENARLVPPSDPVALADGIASLIDDPAFAERLAQRAFEDAAQYSWDRRAQSLETLFAQVVRPS